MLLLNIKRTFFIATTLLLYSNLPSFGCLNGESKELKDGTMLYTDEEGIVPYGHNFWVTETNEDGENEVANDLHRLDSLWKTTGDIEYRSDYGVLLIILGQYQEAIDLYQDIERTNPGLYATASNLGTALELAGDNENALKWIKRAVEINPAAHFHSEWIHVKILEAKIKGEQFFNSDFLLGTNFGNETIPTSNYPDSVLLTLRQALYYQLNERSSFVKSHDKIVAVLLFELGNIAWLTDAKSECYEIYQLAKKYGMQNSLFESRLMYAERWSYENSGRGWLLDNLNIVFVLGLCSIGVVWIVIRKLKKSPQTKI